MKRLVLAFAVGLLGASAAFAGNDDPPPLAPETPTSSAPVTLPIALPARTNNAFKAGELLTFVIKYEFVSAGEATMEVLEGADGENGPTLQLQSRAASNGFVDSFFKVRDFNASTIDRRSMVSVHFHQNLREGHYRVVRNTAMNYKTGTYTFSRESKGKVSERAGTISQPVQDILSAFFFARTMPLKPGETYQIPVFSDGRVYPLGLKVLPKIEKVKVPAGTFECLRIEPTVLGDAIFKARDGRMTIWLTNDNRRMPVLIRSRVFIGAFDAELVTVREGN